MKKINILIYISLPLVVVMITVALLLMNGFRTDLFFLNTNAPFKEHRAFMRIINQRSLNLKHKFGADSELILTNLETGKSFQYFSDESQIHERRSIASIGKLFIARAAYNSNADNSTLNKMLCLSDPLSARKLYDAHDMQINGLLSEYAINQAGNGKQTVTSEMNAMSLPDLQLFLQDFAQELMAQKQILPKNALQKGCTAQNIKFNSQNKIMFAKTGSASFKGILTSKLLVVAFYNHRKQPYLLTIRIYNDMGLCRKGEECFDNLEFQKLVAISDNFTNF